MSDKVKVRWIYRCLNQLDARPPTWRRRVQRRERSIMDAWRQRNIGQDYIISTPCRQGTESIGTEIHAPNRLITQSVLERNLADDFQIRRIDS